MTLITTYKNENSSFIICDLRLTKRKSGHQYDRTLKFMGLDNRIGLFLSGDVDFWKISIPLIESKLPEITFDNINDIDEVFWQELSFSAINYKGNIARAIVFIIDAASNRHKLLKVEIKPEQGALINEISDKETIVIGSASDIPNIEPYLDSIYEESYKFYKGDTYCIASNFRFEILNQMKKCGSSSFKKLGISPIMIISILDGNYFRICGEEGEGGNYSSKNIYTYKYEFSKTKDNILKLRDHNNGDEFKIIEIDDLNELSGADQLFDPAKLTEEYDPSVYFESHNHIYAIKQSLFPKMIGDMSNHIFRCVDRIDFITRHRFCKSMEIKRNDIDKLDNNEFSKYRSNGKLYFVLEAEIEKSFLEELSEDKIFDHQWLSKFIPDYYDKMYENT